jgi:hypothetical protein
MFDSSIIVLLVLIMTSSASRVFLIFCHSLVNARRATLLCAVHAPLFAIAIINSTTGRSMDVDAAAIHLHASASLGVDKACLVGVQLKDLLSKVS